MKRRAFTVGLGSLAFAWPMAIPAQAPRRVGALMGFAESDPGGKRLLHTFGETLAALGWKAGGGLRIDVRWAGAGALHASAAAKELLGLKPEVIFATTTPATSALKQLDATVPTVFVAVSDPIGSGFVKTLSHPGGNMTGFTNLESSLGEKWLQLLKEIAPRVSRVAVMFNPKTAAWGFYLPTIAAAASRLGITQFAARVESEADIARVIEDIGRQPGSGLLCMADIYMATYGKRISQLAAANKVPTIHFFMGAVQDGALIAYGVDIGESVRQAAAYVDRILRGAQPKDLPVQQPSKFEMAVNKTTAKALGLTIPQSILLRADRVVE